MTAISRPNPEPPRTDDEIALQLELRSLANLVLQRLEVCDFRGAQRAFTDAVEVLEAARAVFGEYEHTFCRLHRHDRRHLG